MRIRPTHWSTVLIAIAMLLAPITAVYAAADPSLAYETVEPSRITLGESAIIRVTSLDGYLQNVPLPTVPGLTFEILGRTQGLEFAGGHSTPAWYVVIRVTPTFVGVFTIPGITPKSPTVGLEVVTADAPNPYAWRSQKPTATPAPMSKAPVPKGIQLKAGGAAFVQLAIPTRPVYVGETVPVDIELGIRPGMVTSLNGPPALSSADFTLSNLSKQPLRRDQMIEGNPFLVMTWHSALAAVKPGDFTLSVETPLSVRVDTRSAEDQAVARMLGWPFSQITYKGAPPKDVKIASATSALKVLSLPTQGRPKDFDGAVGDFQVSSETSATHVAAGDPLTLRLRISGVGNFDRVDSAMFDHLDHWKTYPAKSSFKPSDPAGNKGEKVFEQPLIAASAGEQSIPPLEFSYFNPKTQHYERASTEPIKVTVSASLADSSLGAPLADSASGGRLTAGLRPDHPQPQSTVSELRPLYFRPPFLAVPTALVLILAGSLFAVRPQPARALSKAAERALAQLDTAARSGDSSSFYGTARTVLLQTFAARWRMSPDQITSTELKARLGTASEDIERLFALADEAKYSDDAAGSTDFQRWLGLIRGQLAGGAG
jgi:oxygen tolerance protein BatD